MNFNEYQQLAGRTVPEDISRRDALSMGALGLAGEAGEVVELVLKLASGVGKVVERVKKHLFHSQPADQEQVKKELGDVLWYVALLASVFGLTLEEIAEANIAKLRKRYPEGFSSAASVAKADEAP